MDYCHECSAWSDNTHYCGFCQATALCSRRCGQKHLSGQKCILIENLPNHGDELPARYFTKDHFPKEFIKNVDWYVKSPMPRCLFCLMDQDLRRVDHAVMCATCVDTHIENNPNGLGTQRLKYFISQVHDFWEKRIKTQKYYNDMAAQINPGEKKDGDMSSPSVDIDQLDEASLALALELSKAKAMENSKSGTLENEFKELSTKEEKL
jgi:hypothetical protein